MKKKHTKRRGGFYLNQISIKPMEDGGMFYFEVCRGKWVHYHISKMSENYNLPQVKGLVTRLNNALALAKGGVK